MKRLLAVLVISLFLITTPVLADEQSSRASRTKDNDGWKNHGEYVSSVAKLHEGGKTVSEAARSDIGKKEDKDDENEHEASPSPSASSSSAGIGTTNPVGGAVVEGTRIELKALIQVLQNIIHSMEHLMTE